MGLVVAPGLDWALVFGPLTQQPDPPATDFETFAEYVTTTEFLISYIVAGALGPSMFFDCDQRYPGPADLRSGLAIGADMRWREVDGVVMVVPRVGHGGPCGGVDCA